MLAPMSGTLRTLDDFMRYLATDRAIKLGTIIDVGACYGTPALLNNFPSAHHILVEPLPQMRERLQYVAQKVGGEYHSVALSDAEGTMTLRFPTQHPDQATLMPTLESLSVHNGRPAEDVTTCEVSVTTLDALLGDRDLPGPILLKTDCQGYDLEALQGGRHFLQRVDLVIVETLLYRASIERETPVFSDVVMAMKGFGFEVFDIVNYQLRPLDAAAAYVDLVFTQRDGPFWREHRYC